MVLTACLIEVLSVGSRDGTEWTKPSTWNILSEFDLSLQEIVLSYIDTNTSNEMVWEGDF